MFLLSERPVALTPEAILRIAVLPCRGCGKRGPHPLIGARAGGFTALCGRCAAPQVPEDASEDRVDALHAMTVQPTNAAA